jgi:hypothetical protein
MKPVADTNYYGETKLEAKNKAIAEFKRFGYHIDRKISCRNENKKSG